MSQPDFVAETDQSRLGTHNLTLEESNLLEEVLKALRQIKFGYIQLTIQDGKVVQLEKTEKQRLAQK